jgi:hypothetical protein
MKRRVGTLIAVAAATGAFVAPSSASAAVTIGSDLTPDPINSVGAGARTVANSQIPGQQVTSPIDGVVVRWRIRAFDGFGSNVRLRVLRPAGAGQFTGVNSSATEAIPASGAPVTYVFVTQQPIQAGDLIGLDADEGANLTVLTGGQAGVSQHTWDPQLVNGATESPDVSGTTELLVNAEIESDCDRDGLGDETQDGDVSSCEALPGTDTVPPDTTISARPKDKTRKKTATFAFGGIDSGPVAGFQCSLDGGAFTPCTSTHTVKVKKGKHTFAVRAIDQAGNIDPSPATDNWKVKKRRKRK